MGMDLPGFTNKKFPRAQPIVGTTHRRAGLLRLGGWLWIMTLCMTNCSILTYGSRDFETRVFTITGTEYGGAFYSAQKAAVQIGLKIRSSDYGDGKFVAWKHQPLIEVAEMRFHLEKEPTGNLSGTLQVKSTKSDLQMLKDFLAIYGKDVTIVLEKRGLEVGK